jgi:hypothetical protein
MRFGERYEPEPSKSMSNDVNRRNIDQRALGAMLSNAFFTWPSAVNIAFFLVMYFLVQLPFGFWQQWMWLVAGVLAEGAYLVATITDPVANQRAVAQMLTEKFNPSTIHNVSARQRVQKAIEYKTLIDKFVGAQGGALKVSLEQTASEINDWIARIYRLAKNIDTFESNSIIDRDRRNVPTELADLKRRLNAETDPGVKAELNEAIQIRQRLSDNLQSIANTAKRAEIQMDNTLAQLGTVYAQMQLIDAKDLDSGRAQRLRESIREEIASLSDTISAMDDVYHNQGYDAGASANVSANVSAAVTNLAAPDDTSSASSTTSATNSGRTQSGGQSR